MEQQTDNVLRVFIRGQFLEGRQQPCFTNHKLRARREWYYECSTNAIQEWKLWAWVANTEV